MIIGEKTRQSSKKERIYLNWHIFFSRLCFYLSVYMQSTYATEILNSDLITQKKIKVVVFGLEISRNIFVSEIDTLALL